MKTKRHKTALDTFMVVDKIKVTRFQSQNLKESVWMWPQDWDKHHNQLRRSLQYLELKVRMIWTFEPIEDAMLLLFPEMMRFP